MADVASRQDGQRSAGREGVATSRAVAVGHEPDQPRLRGVALGAGAIIAAVVIAIVAGYFVVHGVSRDIAAYGVHPTPAITGGPRLQATPEKDFPAFHAEKWQRLHEYGWVDRAHGIVRIPIERAMQLLVEQQRTAKGKR